MRVVVAGQQGETAELVAFPLADLGAGDVTDVVDVEEKQGAAAGILECCLGAGKAEVRSPVVIDPAFEIHGHVAMSGIARFHDHLGSRSPGFTILGRSAFQASFPSRFQLAGICLQRVFHHWMTEFNRHVCNRLQIDSELRKCSTAANHLCIAVISARESGKHLQRNLQLLEIDCRAC